MTLANVVLIVLLVVCALAALFFLLRGLRLRTSQTQQAYGVAQQETRHEMQVNFLRAGFLLLLALILLGIYGLLPGEGDAATGATATMTPTATRAAPSTGPSSTPIPAVTGTLEDVEEATEAAPTLTATVAPTMTATTPPTEAPVVATAVVNSPNGLWLREAPGGTNEVELIAHETVLELLPGRETADDLEWQEVRTPAGNVGWVAAEFLIYQ